MMKENALALRLSIKEQCPDLLRKKRRLIMKTIKSLALASLLTFFCCLSAAETAENLLPVTALKQAGETRWQQTYQAHGRTIRIDAAIEIPDVDKVPVLRATRWFPIMGDDIPRWEQYFRKPDEKPYNYYDFNILKEQGTTVFTYNITDAYSSEKWFGKVKYGLREDPHAHWADIYAEDNPLSMQEAFAFIQEKVSFVFSGDVPLYPLYGAGTDTPRLKKTGERLYDHGQYEFRLMQLIRGIPVMADVDNLYFPSNGPALGDYMPYFRVDATVYSEDSYSVDATLIQETAIIHEDIPLFPFETVKPVVEDLIKQGHIRDIYKISLCYIPFHNQYDLGNSYMLLPAWGVTCEFMRTAEQAPYAGGWAEPYWHSDTCRQIVINAQTGKLFDPFETDERRMLAPVISP